MKAEYEIIDFETQAIEGRPKYPPVPVGYSIKSPGDKHSTYWSWGHPTDNNCSKEQAQRRLKAAWKSGRQLVFQNAKFDVDVAATHMGMPAVPWDRIEDTMFLIYLHNPHAPTYGLKPSAQAILGMPPTEQDAVRQWLVDNNIVIKNDKRWGAHISKAPGGIVGRYADGDVLRTERLLKRLLPEIKKRGMHAAYNRERELMPILLENEREGIRIDIPLIDKELAIYERGMDIADNWLRKKLRAPDLDVDKDDQLADALENAGIVTEWVATDTGRRSTSKKNMSPDMFKDPRIASVLGWRNRAATCVRVYMRPWLDLATKGNGRLHLNWNQVRQMRGSSDTNTAGARTGRMSCNPNLMAVSKVWDDKNDGYTHPTFLTKCAVFARLARDVPSKLAAAFAQGLPLLPLVRRYILPDKGGVICHRDYNQQELRILGHYENGGLMQAYKDNPLLDVHDWVKDKIFEIIGLALERRQTKIINFGTIYGRGFANLAEALNTDVAEAKKIKSAQLSAVPGLKALNTDIKDLVKAGQPITTWGGREYYCEEPKIVDSRLRTFEYKLLNYLIQGSAADCTKQAIINYHHNKRDGRWLLAVHDENNISAPKKTFKSEIKLLKEAMESVKFDVPMLSDAKVGSCWGELEKYKDAT